MKIISAHIENFGKLSGEDFSFEKGLNIFVRENGWGKSTLGAFIRVMLYGFDSEGKRSALENERKRFAPWQGGIYGGSLVFEARGKRYRIERTFDEKKGAGDVFNLYDDETNLESADFTTRIGTEIFGLDAASFERTVFAGQLSCETEVTSGISAKIGNVSDDAMDMANYEDAMAALKKEMDRLTPDRKTGEINRLSREEALLDASVRGKDVLERTIDDVSRELTSVYDKRDELRAHQRELHEKIKKLGEISEARAEGQRYLVLKENIQKSEEKLREEEAYFPKEIPDENQIDIYTKRSNYISAMRKDAENGALSDEEKDQYERLSKIFSDGLPSDMERQQAEDNLSRIEELKAGSEYMKLSRAEEEKLESLENTFSSDMPAVEEVINLQSAWEERTRRKAALPAKEAAYLLLEKQEKNRSKKIALGILISVLVSALAALGVYLGYSKDITYAAVTAGAVFAVVMILYWIIALKKRNNGELTSDPAGLLSEIEDDREYINKTRNKAMDFFASVNIKFEEDTFGMDIVRIQDMVEKHDELTRREEDYENALKSPEIEKCRSEVNEFIKKYRPDVSEETPVRQVVSEINSDADLYSNLCARSLEAKKVKDGFLREKNAILNFIEDLGFRPEADVSAKINEIRDHVIAVNNAKKALEDAEKEAGNFEKEHPDIVENLVKASDDTDDDIEDMDELNKSFEEIGILIDECESNIRSYRQQLRAENEKLEKAQNDEASLAVLREKKELLQKRYKVINLAREGLKEAHEKFSARYMDPVKRSFDEYYSLLAGDEKAYELDANLGLSLKEKGHSRDLGFLSPGHRDAVGLCRRLSMVDAMYEGEKPFIILDDPFVNMDDDKLSGAKDFLDKISDIYQIIYFTCSSKRSMSGSD